MGPASGLKVCNGQACLSDGPENAFTLGYGHAVRVGPFRCTSRTSGTAHVLAVTGAISLTGDETRAISGEV